MKNIAILLIAVLCFMSCKQDAEKQAEAAKEPTVEYASFGEKIIADDAIDAASMAKHYKGIKVGDSINAKVRAKVNSVCQAKGCWMKLDLENGEEVFVKFKDYAFFVPMNIAGDEVIINGKAFVKETPVAQLRHYAEDAGKSKEEIEKITEPKRTLGFLADGVLLATN